MILYLDKTWNIFADVVERLQVVIPSIGHNVFKNSFEYAGIMSVWMLWRVA